MDALPKDIEYHVIENDVEITEGGRHIGWERRTEIHRIVTKDDSGRKIVTNDTIVSTDLEQFVRDNPKVELHGISRPPSVDSIKKFLSSATPEQLAELGIPAGQPPVGSVDNVTTPQDDDDEDEDETPAVPNDADFPFALSDGLWVLSDGSKVEGSEDDALNAEMALMYPKGDDEE